MAIRREINKIKALLPDGSPGKVKVWEQRPQEACPAETRAEVKRVPPERLGCPGFALSFKVGAAVGALAEEFPLGLL